MKKIFLLLLLIAFLVGCEKQRDGFDDLLKDMQEATESAGYWSSYTELTQGNIATGDDFLVRDVSATPPAGGQQKRLLWSSLKKDMHSALLPRQCFTLEDPADTDIDVPIFSHEVAFTVTDMRCWTQGGTSVTIHLEDQSNDALDSMVCDADGTNDDGSIANATFSADEQMEFDITAVSGAVDWLNFCFTPEITTP